MLSLVHMSRRPRADPRPAQAGGPVPQRGAGLHDRGGQGRGPGARARRHPRLPRPRLSRARADLGRAAARDDDVARRARTCPAEYVPMLMEEMELDGADARRVAAPTDVAAREAFPVVVIGCGESGLLAGIRLQGGRHPVHDRREERRRRRHLVGELVPGRPGRRRQPLLLLQLRAERPLDRVLRPAARAAGVLRGRDGQARHRAARPVGDRGARRRRGTTTSATWSVRVRARRRRPRRRSSARAVISAVGQLNRPNIPDIPGQDDFAGPSFHSARWDHDVDLAGKRVAMIGAGASGFQIAPTIARRRSGTSPSSSAPRSGCSRTRTTTRRSGPGVRWALRHLPVLRALVPVPDLLARLRQGARGRAGRPRLPGPAGAPSAR